MGQVTTEVYGFTGTGATLKAARENAQEQAALGMRGTYTPRVLQYRGETLVVARTPHGWGYRMVRLEEGKPEYVSACSLFSADADFADVWRKAVRHLAQATMVLDDEAAPSFVTEEADRREWASYRDWQRGYRKLVSEGKTDDEARRVLSGF